VKKKKPNQSSQRNAMAGPILISRVAHRVADLKRSAKKKAPTRMIKERRSPSLSVIIWLMRTVTLVIALWAGFIVFFVNPINWKLYSELTTWDWAWSWFSNISTLLLALALWWWVQGFLTRKIDQKKEPKCDPETPNP
jgi:hypothetical protein